jgi:hypothetical protein
MRESATPSEADASGILAMLIDLGQAQIDRQLETSDGHDVKGLGLLAANVAAIGLAIALSPRWTPWWLIPMAMAAVSCGAYLYTVRGRSYNVGPVVEEFYRKHGGTTLVEAQRHLLAQLISAIDDNNTRLPEKRQGFIVGTATLVSEVGLGGLLLWLLDTGRLT